MRSQLTETFKRVTGMIDYVRENLDDGEYDLFLDLIVPEPERVVEKSKPVKRKKIEHCEVCNYTRRALIHKDESVRDYHQFQLSQPSSKSKRAKSIAEAVQKVTKLKDPARDEDGHIDSSKLCSFIVNDATGEQCDAIEDDPIHDLTYSSSHEFTPGKSHALAVGEGS